MFAGEGTMNFFQSLRRAMQQPASRWGRFACDVIVDVVLLTLALGASFYIVHDLQPVAALPPSAITVALGMAVASVVLLYSRGMYSVNPRYLGLHDFLNVAGVCFALAIPVAYIERAFNITGVHNGVVLVPILFAFFSAGLLTGLRVLQRAIAWRPLGKTAATEVGRRRTIIVGAGDAGETIFRELSRGRHGTHQVIGFIDDHPEKQSLRIHGASVLGDVSNIPDIVETYRVDEILIALPTASGPQIRRVYDFCNKTSARVKTLPGLGEMIAGERLSKMLREIEIEDLLRREPVKTNIEEISRYLHGEHVLITGGGGSIGSELARQVSRMGPGSIILVGKGENSIYEIEQELRQTTRMEPVTVIADVRDREAMNKVFEKYRPTVVFHAAAHKHVPLMQKNPAEAIRNNIIGTLNTAELAIKYGVKKFILISTDKAVNPSSVMGATKRICEMFVCGLGQRSETQFSAVRFGNVLGSRGSLIPLLKAQIRRGGPVTVTHKDMTRFFMTIPEAVSLVTQAGAIGERGEIFILDMGDPVKIEDLAVELIRMHGLVPGDDIEVRYTGIRPGEKMHEELLYAQEDLKPTTHPKIRMVADQPRINLRALRQCTDRLLSLCQEGQEDTARQFLMELASGKMNLDLMSFEGNNDAQAPGYFG